MIYKTTTLFSMSQCLNIIENINKIFTDSRFMILGMGGTNIYSKKFSVCIKTKNILNKGIRCICKNKYVDLNFDNFNCNNINSTTKGKSFAVFYTEGPSNFMSVHQYMGCLHIVDDNHRRIYTHDTSLGLDPTVIIGLISDFFDADKE